MKRRRSAREEAEQSLVQISRQIAANPETLHGQTLAAIDRLADLMSEFGIHNGEGNEIPAIVLFLPSLQRMAQFVVEHKKAADKLAILQAMGQA